MLKIEYINEGYIAKNISSSEVCEILCDEPISETDMRDMLKESGFTQQEVELALIQCRPEYFSVGKW